MYLDGKERSRECPPEYQEILTQRYGVNPYGQPRYKLVWGQRQSIVMGTMWRDQYGNERAGYKTYPQCNNVPCWVLMQWHPSSDYGTPEAFYASTYDESSGLYVTGEYPYEGRYEVVQMFYQKEWVKDPFLRLQIHRFPMSTALVDVIIPIAIKAQRMSEFEKARAKAEAEEIRHKQEVNEAADKLADNLPAWYGPTVFSGQGNKNSVLQRKDDELEALFKRFPHLRVEAERRIQERKKALEQQEG